jgi:hypothetical protein
MFDRLAARLADPAPVMICKSCPHPRRPRDESLHEVAVVHIAGPPADAASLALLKRSLRGHADDLLSLWARWNGLALYAEPSPQPSNFLVALYPPQEMEPATQAMRPWLAMGERRAAAYPDLAVLRDAIVIGGPAMAANALVVLGGERAGTIAVFDHETLSAEPIASDATELAELLASDPIALARRLGGTCRYRFDDRSMDQLYPVEYRPDARAVN